MSTRTHRGGILAAAWTAVVFGLTACSSREAVVETEPGMEGGQTAEQRPMGQEAAATEWTATIRSLEDDGHNGSATARALPDGRTEVTVTLSGGSGGGEHPWHVHRGTCGSNGEIVGSKNAYPILRPDQSGYASETARIDTALDPSGSYYINIHQSPNQLDVIVACGELRQS